MSRATPCTAAARCMATLLPTLHDAMCYGGMLDGIYWCIFPRRYARRGLLELLDAAARQAHHGAPLHLEHEQLGPAVQEGRKAAHARLEDLRPHRGRGEALQRRRGEHGAARVVGRVLAPGHRRALLTHERRGSRQATWRRYGLAGREQLGERVGVGTHESDEGALLEPQLRKGAV